MATHLVVLIEPREEAQYGPAVRNERHAPARPPPRVSEQGLSGLGHDREEAEEAKIKQEQDLVNARNTKGGGSLNANQAGGTWYFYNATTYS